MFLSTRLSLRSIFCFFRGSGQTTASARNLGVWKNKKFVEIGLSQLFKHTKPCLQPVSKPGKKHLLGAVGERVPKNVQKVPRLQRQTHGQTRILLSDENNPKNGHDTDKC